MPIINFKEHTPEVAADCWIAPDAWVIGDCVLESKSSVFFGAVLRGDVNRIIIGAGSNIQDQAMLHTSHGLGNCVVGADVTVGHRAILHGCQVKDRCIIGMGTTILDNAIIEEDCIIGANSLVSMNTVIPAGSMAFGSPAKVIRKLSQAELQQLKDSACSYRATSSEYFKMNLIKLLENAS